MNFNMQQQKPAVVAEWSKTPISQIQVGKRLLRSQVRIRDGTISNAVQ